MKHTMMPSSISYFDLLIQTIGIYTVSVGFILGWELLNLILKKIFRSSFFGTRQSVAKWSHFVIL